MLGTRPLNASRLVRTAALLTRLVQRVPAADASGRRMRDHTKGQALVEFCLVALLFFSLLFAIFDLGIFLNDWISVTTQASEGARQAAVGACFEGPSTDPTASPGQTSVIGAIMESAPVLATGGDDCQNPPAPQPLGTETLCVTRVDIAIGNLSVPGDFCRDAELWANRQTAQAGSTVTVIHTTGPAWNGNTLVGRRLTFASGSNADAMQIIASNTANTITVGSAFPNLPGVGDKFNVTALTLLPITAGWLACSATTPSPEMNDALKIVVRSLVQLPVPLAGLPTNLYAENSSTVRFEGTYVQ
jgi:hypothetical protein